MDSQDRDETKIRQRQELLARRVGEALDQMKPHGEGECPDAEVIAAYAEQALGPAESAEWEGHFAACARCRKILRVLAASADTPLAEKEVAQLGKLVSAVRAPVEITERSAVRARPRFVDWRTRWLAPAIGVAAVLAGVVRDAPALARNGSGRFGNSGRAGAQGRIALEPGAGRGGPAFQSCAPAGPKDGGRASAGSSLRKCCTTEFASRSASERPRGCSRRPGQNFA